MENNILTNYLKGNFSQIPNNLILDENLSNTSKMIIIYLFTRADGWVVRNSDVCNVCKISNTTLSKKWKELINSGWLSRTEIRDEKGLFVGYNYNIGGNIVDNIKTTEYVKNITKSTPKQKDEIDWTIIEKYNDECQKLIKEFWDMKKELNKGNKKYKLSLESFNRMIKFIDINNVENDLDLLRIAIEPTNQWAQLYTCSDYVRISNNYKEKSKNVNNINSGKINYNLQDSKMI